MIPVNEDELLNEIPANPTQNGIRTRQNFAFECNNFAHIGYQGQRPTERSFEKITFIRRKIQLGNNEKLAGSKN